MSTAKFPDLREIIDVNHPEEWVGVHGVCEKIEFIDSACYPIETHERAAWR